MNVFVRAVITGFGYSLGASLYKKISKRFEDDESSDKNEQTATPAPPFAAGKPPADDGNGADDGADDDPDHGQPSDPN